MVAIRKAMALLIVLLSFGTHAAQGPGAGQVQFANGDVRIVAANATERAARKGDVIEEGDTVATAGGATAQLVMADGGIIALREGTRLQIQTFRFEGREDGTERSLLRLTRGAFRTITGVIGRRNRDTYRVQTATATIGIRGTDHEVAFVPAPTPGEKPVGEPGTYNKVNEGETFIQNARGVLVVGANQVGFAGVDASAMPVRLPRVPDFMRAAVPPRAVADKRPIRETAQADARRDLAPRAERAPQPTTLLALQRVVEGERVIRPIEVADTALDLRNPVAGVGALTPAPVGSVFVGGEFSPVVGELGSGGLFVDGSTAQIVMLDAAKNPIIVSSTEEFRFSRDGAPLVDSGAANVNGTGVQWGIYAGGTIASVSRGIYRTTYFHFMGAPNASSIAELTVPGSASFSTVAGFTKPIDEQGRIGGHVLLNVSLVFGAVPRVTAYNLQVQDAGGRNWTGALQSTQPLSTFATNSGGGPNLNVTCSGACQPSGLGKASGFVIGGAARDAMISSYTLKTPNAAVTGSAVVK